MGKSLFKGQISSSKISKIINDITLDNDENEEDDDSLGQFPNNKENEFEDWEDGEWEDVTDWDDEEDDWEDEDDFWKKV